LIQYRCAPAGGTKSAPRQNGERPESVAVLSSVTLTVREALLEEVGLLARRRAGWLAAADSLGAQAPSTALASNTLEIRQLDTRCS
jgi:hypothetical protein